MRSNLGLSPIFVAYLYTNAVSSYRSSIPAVRIHLEQFAHRGHGAIAQSKDTAYRRFESPCDESTTLEPSAPQLCHELFEKLKSNSYSGLRMHRLPDPGGQHAVCIDVRMFTSAICN